MPNLDSGFPFMNYEGLLKTEERSKWIKASQPELLSTIQFNNAPSNV